ncbi:MAG TPA: hypothetical protein DHV21_15670 [Curvibacter sp.]|nr:hypothetical protein [Curvibacter sp.]
MDLDEIWRQGRIPVVFRRERPLPLLIKLPYSLSNKEWLRDGQVRKPSWDAAYKSWEVPQAWFERVVRLCVRRHRWCYVVQLHRERQVCAPACWNAEGMDCECSCMGANHGGGQPVGRWYEVDETFAVSWGIQRYAVRLVRAK